MIEGVADDGVDEADIHPAWNVPLPQQLSPHCVLADQRQAAPTSLPYGPRHACLSGARVAPKND